MYEALHNHTSHVYGIFDILMGYGTHFKFWHTMDGSRRLEMVQGQSHDIKS
jgi:hypothetical protein